MPRILAIIIPLVLMLPATASAAGLKIVSWNLENLAEAPNVALRGQVRTQADYDNIRNLIAEQAPDIIALQEIGSRKGARLVISDDYEIVFESRCDANRASTAKATSTTSSQPSPTARALRHSSRPSRSTALPSRIRIARPGSAPGPWRRRRQAEARRADLCHPFAASEGELQEERRRDASRPGERLRHPGQADRHPDRLDECAGAAGQHPDHRRRFQS